MPARRPIEQRFWEKVKEGEVPAACPELGRCLVWTASTDGSGYGFLGDGKGGLLKAHRYSWEIHHGPTEKCVLHHCDNPPCVNPDHLYEGTQKENARDREARGRSNHPQGDAHHSRQHPEGLARGERHGNAVLTQSQVDELRAGYVKKYGEQKKWAAKFGVGILTIQRALKGQTYKE